MRDRNGGPINVLVVDDDPLARAAIRGALESDPELEICGEAINGVEAVALAASCDPDVIVMDVVMPELDGIGATRRIIAGDPDRKIVVLAALDDDDLALLALRSGALGYLPKHTNLAILPRVLRAVLAGEAAVSRMLTARLLKEFRTSSEGTAGLRPVRSELTSREWEVLDLLSMGRSTGEIATELEMSTETVRSHVKRILRKLGVHSRVEAVLAVESIRNQPLGSRGLGSRGPALAVGGQVGGAGR